MIRRVAQTPTTNELPRRSRVPISGTRAAGHGVAVRGARLDCERPSLDSHALCNTPAVSRVFVATAGWSVPRQHAALAKAEGSGLEKYASVLGAAEINSTFYRRHQAKTYERWRDSVPAAFRFAVKLPRAITHEAALASPARALAEFFDDVCGLREKLGPVLVQLPASAAFDRRRARAFFRALRARHAGPVACEPRHPGWYTQTASATLLEYDIARVVADPPRPLDAIRAGGSESLRYTRWHGSPQIYWSSYSDERLLSLVNETLSAPAQSDIWCVFDNTASGSALNDAHRFRALLAARMNRRGPGSRRPVAAR